MTEIVDLGRIREDLNRLSQIEAKLNRRLADHQFRKDLFADPVKVLKDAGIVIPKDREQALVELFNSAKVPENAVLRLGTAKADDPYEEPQPPLFSIGISW